MNVQAGVTVRRRERFSPAALAQLPAGVVVMALDIPPVVVNLPGYWET
jgi:S1-C subfamily serine protease